jgi:hypothetical protein
MKKKMKKKSWQKHNIKSCNCFHCEGNWFQRLVIKTRVRDKFFKSPFLNIIYILTLIIILSSCNAQKRCENHYKKAKEMGCIKETDSVRVVVKYIKGDTLISYVPVYIDTNSLDSLSKLDTCYTKERVKTIIQKLKVNPVSAIDSNYNLQIWLQDGKIQYSLKIPSRKDSIIYRDRFIEKKDISPTEKFYMPIWLVWLVCILGIISIVLSLKRSNE